MRGHIRKRGRNSWAVVVPLPRDPETGKPRQKWVTVRGTRKDAEAVLAKLLAEAHAGGLGTAPARLTLGEYLERWLGTVEPDLKPSSRKTYRSALKQWKQTGLADIPLSKLTPLAVQQAVAKLRRHLAPATVRNAIVVLRSAVNQAVKWGLLGKNPLDGVKVPPTKERKKEMKVWTEQEAVRFLEAAKKSKHYPLFALALATGMRLGELLGLKWEDVDLEEGVIYVRRNLVNRGVAKSVAFTTPKSDAGNRRIPLDPATVEALRRHKKRQAETRLKKGPEWHDFGLVFCTNRGLPLYHSNVEATFKRLAEKARVPVIRFHDLRHTHATLLLRKRVHPKIVSERLGHSNIGVTLDTYSHVLPDTQTEAVRAIEGIMRRGETEKPGRKRR